MPDGRVKVGIFMSIFYLPAFVYLIYPSGPEKEVREFLTCLGYFLYFILYIDIVIYKVDTCTLYEVRHIFFCYTVSSSINKLNNLKSEGKVNTCNQYAYQNLIILLTSKQWNHIT